MKGFRTSDERKIGIYGFEAVSGAHNFYALLDFDVTGLRASLRNERREGRGGSLFAFVLKAVARCLREFPELNAMANLRRTTRFDEVDIAVPIEIEKDGKPFNKQLLLRDVDRASIEEIDASIAESKRAGEGGKDRMFPAFALKILCRLPAFIVLAFMRAMIRNHRAVRELSGTVFVTSVSMFSTVPGYIVPYAGGPKAVSFAIGSVAPKPVVYKGQICAREMLNVCVIFNHDLVDGAPAARFINRFRQLIERDWSELL